MSKIDVITQHIVDKLKTVNSFNNRVGLAVGGTEIDPINIDLPRPAAWAIFTGIPILDQSLISTKNVSVSYNYAVKVLVDYGDEVELISTTFPLLEEVITTMKGSGINGLPFHEVSFNGMSLESLEPDRMVWIFNLSVATSL